MRWMIHVLSSLVACLRGKHFGSIIARSNGACSFAGACGGRGDTHCVPQCLWSGCDLYCTSHPSLYYCVYVCLHGTRHL